MDQSGKKCSTCTRYQVLKFIIVLEWDPKQCGHGPGQRGFSQAAGQDSNTVQVGKK